MFLCGLSWTNEGRDLLLTVRFTNDAESGGASGHVLHCSWVSGLHVNLKFLENRGGFPLTWDVTFEPTGGGWKIDLDFADAGQIYFCCTQVAWV